MVQVKCQFYKKKSISHVSPDQMTDIGEAVKCKVQYVKNCLAPKFNKKVETSGVKFIKIFRAVCL